MASKGILPAVEFARALEAAGVVSDLDTISRIVIDVDPHDLVKVYVERVCGPELKQVAGLLGEMMAAGRAVNAARPGAVRYWVPWSAELLDSSDIRLGLVEAGLRIAEIGGWRDPHTRWVRIEDPGAPEELDGKEVELVFQRTDSGPVRVLERKEVVRQAPEGGGT